MGSFFQKAINPVASFAGPNSFFAKEASYDPIMKNSDLGKSYAGRDPTSQSLGLARPEFSGRAPTLSDANNEYLSAAIKAGQNAGTNRQPAQQPIAAPTKQPMVPRMWG